MPGRGSPSGFWQIGPCPSTPYSILSPTPTPCLPVSWKPRARGDFPFAASVLATPSFFLWPALRGRGLLLAKQMLCLVDLKVSSRRFMFCWKTSLSWRSCASSEMKWRLQLALYQKMLDPCQSGGKSLVACHRALSSALSCSTFLC